MTRRPLEAFFRPRSIAVVGASASRTKAGHFLLKNILDGGYPGRVYPINPDARRILGCRAFPSVRELPEAPDLVFVLVPPAQVASVLRDCASRRVKAAAIVTAGFGEVGERGRALQQELARIIRQGGMRAVGPNSVGLVSAPARLVGSFVPFRRWPAGPVAIAAQTGIFTGAYVDEVVAAPAARIGFSRSLCLGNKIDVDEVDFVRDAGADPATRVIALHLESFSRPRAFLRVANRVKRLKPVIVLKTGRTAAGARAASSHSGALASQDRIVDAALRQFGIVRADTLEEFIGTTAAFATQPVPRGNRVAVVTLSGALGVMAVDELRSARLELAVFAPDTVRRIAALMPPWQPVQNPADVWMALGAGPARAHAEILDAVLADRGVDMLLAILLPIPNADFPDVRDVFGRLVRRHPAKPVVLVLVGGRTKQRWLDALEPLGLPVFAEPRPAVRAMEAMRFYAAERRRARTLEP